MKIHFYWIFFFWTTSNDVDLSRCFLFTVLYPKLHDIFGWTKSSPYKADMRCVKLIREDISYELGIGRATTLINRIFVRRWFNRHRVIYNVLLIDKLTDNSNIWFPRLRRFSCFWTRTCLDFANGLSPYVPWRLDEFRVGLKGTSIVSILFLVINMYSSELVTRRYVLKPNLLIIVKQVLLLFAAVVGGW